MRVVLPFFEQRKFVVLEERQRERNERDVNAEPGNAIVLVDQNQPDRQRDVNQALNKQREPRAKTDEQHQAGGDEQRTEQMIKSRQSKLGQQRLVGELFFHRGGDAGIIGERVVFYADIVQHAAGVRLAGRRINQRLLDGFVSAEFFDARQEGADGEPAAQQEKRHGFAGAAAGAFHFVF